MSPTIESLGIDQLSITERINLAQEILDSVAAEQPPPPISEATKQELKRRIADHKANPDDVILWEEIAADADARWNK